jgi:DNA polymerase I
MEATIKDAYQLLHDGSIALSQIESNGIKIDVDYLNRAIKETEEKIREKESNLKKDEVYKTWQRTYGYKTALGSPYQLSHVLFDVLKYEYPYEIDEEKAKDKKKRRYKADADLFNQIDIPFTKEYISLNKLKKVRDTYLEGIRKELVDGYIHPFFNLHTVISYRSSSDRINFQNQPIRDPEQGEIVRRCFIPRGEHYQITDADFKGAEVKVSACINKDPTLLAYIRDPTSDMHRDMAIQLYCLDEKQVTKELRYDAKSYFVFAEFYGDYYIHCAKSLWKAIEGKKAADGMTIKKILRQHGIRELGDCDPDIKDPPKGTFEKHVKDVEKDFWEVRFPVYGQWKNDWWKEYQNKGYFDMPTGFRVTGILKKKEVINYVVQGSSFHCLLWTLIRLQNWLVKNKMMTKIIGQIHDNIVLDIHRKEIQDVLDKIKRIVEVDLPRHWPWIIVPMEIEIEVAPIGGSWHEKAPWIQKDGIWVPKVA